MGGTVLLSALLASSLLIWYCAEGSIAVNTVRSPKVEMFYWVTIMFSQTLGTALGDWTADTAGLGYDGAAEIFGSLLLLVVLAYNRTNISRVILFWAAFVLTRPLGAVLGDYLDKPIAHGGLELSCYTASEVLLALIVIGFLIFPGKASQKNALVIREQYTKPLYISHDRKQMFDKNRKKLLLFLMVLLSDAAFAGPPFVTDDPETLEKNAWEVNYAVSKTWRDSGASAAIPSIDINYGLTPDIQLHAQPRYSYEYESGSKIFGFDNTEVGVKYRFSDQNIQNQHIMLGIYPMLQLPSGNKKLGDTRGKTQLFLPIWAQFDTEKWNVYGGTGYRINQSLNSKNSWFLGLTTLYKVHEDLRLGGEIYSESATEHQGNSGSGFNLGGIYNMTPDYHLLFSFGQALNNVPSTNRLSGFLALQVVY